MPYIYETHLHTKIGSRCSNANPKDYIPYYLDRGFTGIIVTDHFINGNTQIDRSLSWASWVDEFYNSYLELKNEGDKKGLDVFFGFEARLGNDECLIYGLTKEWLKENKIILSCDHKTQYELVKKAGGAIVQAHPFRERVYMSKVEIYPDYVDAFEGYNLNNSRLEDQKAIKLAKERNKIITAGSDIHTIRDDNLTPFGVISNTKWSTIYDYVNMLKSSKQFDLYIPDEKKRNEFFTLDMQVIIH